MPTPFRSSNCLHRPPCAAIQLLSHSENCPCAGQSRCFSVPPPGLLRKHPMPPVLYVPLSTGPIMGIFRYTERRGFDSWLLLSSTTRPRHLPTAVVSALLMRMHSVLPLSAACMLSATAWAARQRAKSPALWQLPRSCGYSPNAPATVPRPPT